MTDPGQDVSASRVPAHRVRDGRDQAVGRVLAESLGERLEAVELAHEDGRRVSIAFQSMLFVAEGLAPCLARSEPGDRVDEGLQFGGIVEVRALGCRDRGDKVGRQRDRGRRGTDRSDAAGHRRIGQVRCA
jgi:hypothetical protein